MIINLHAICINYLGFKCASPPNDDRTKDWWRVRLIKFAAKRLNISERIGGDLLSEIAKNFYLASVNWHLLPRLRLFQGSGKSISRSKIGDTFRWERKKGEARWFSFEGNALSSRFTRTIRRISCGIRDGRRREDKISFSCTYLRCFETKPFLRTYVHKSVVLLCPLVCSARWIEDSPRYSRVIMVGGDARPRVFSDTSECCIERRRDYLFMPRVELQLARVEIIQDTTEDTCCTPRR